MAPVVRKADDSGLTARAHVGGDHALELWLWEASVPGRCRGITDAAARARNVAEACIKSGQASTVRVEQACLVMNDWMDSEYQRTGVGWSARLSDGNVIWRPLAPGKPAAASNGEKGDGLGSAR